jgi:hypothetical protein
MKKSISLLILMLLICSSGFSQTRIKTLFYNLLYYPSGAPNDRELTLKLILDTYNPDIFTVCELETVEGADEILSQSIQASRPNFISNNLTASSDLHIVPGTYDAYGNNKNCYDKDIKDTSYTGEYSQSLRDDLYIMSDHNPVVMELETTKTILSVKKSKLQSEFRMLGSNLINSNVSIQISSYLYKSKLLIYNQLGQLVKTTDTTTDSQILTDVSNLSNGMYFITSSIKNHVNPIKFLKIN